MGKFNILSIFTHAKENFPQDAKELLDAIGLLDLALDGLREKTIRHLSELALNKQYSKSKDYLDMSEEISMLQADIAEYCAMLINDNDNDEEDEDIIEEEQKIQRQDIPSYAECAVDSTIAHTLYESFTHTRPCAFSLNGKKYEASEWKDILLLTCDLLSEIDADKFYEFIDDPTMKGRKISYFGNKYVDKKNAKMKNIDIYVWTNLSANLIRNIIRKMLKKFDIKITNFYVYLSADYTARHIDSEKYLEPSDSASPEDKIGKYVRLTMRQLSNQQRKFTKNEIMDMQSKQWSKDTLGLDYPLIKPYLFNIDISGQIKEGSYGRYWKEIFEFNESKFLVTSQWYERNREAFAKWIENLL